MRVLVRSASGGVLIFDFFRFFGATARKAAQVALYIFIKACAPEKACAVDVGLEALLRLPPACSMSRPPFLLGAPTFRALYGRTWIVCDLSSFFLIGCGLHRLVLF